MNGYFYLSYYLTKPFDEQVMLKALVSTFSRDINVTIRYQ